MKTADDAPFEMEVEVNRGLMAGCVQSLALSTARRFRYVDSGDGSQSWEDESAACAVKIFSLPPAVPDEAARLDARLIATLFEL